MFNYDNTERKSQQFESSNSMYRVKVNTFMFECLSLELQTANHFFQFLHHSKKKLILIRPENPAAKNFKPNKLQFCSYDSHF